MALIFRLSPERIMRSVDDQPGIVGLGLYDDGPSFGVNGHYEPPAASQRVPAGSALIVGEIAVLNADAAQWAEPVALGDAVDACEGPDELRVLLLFLSVFVAGAAQQYAPTGNFEAVGVVVEFAVRARDAIATALQERGV